MPSRPAALVLAAALLAVAPAQQRRALLGRALDVAGQPLAGASVTLVRVEAGAIGLVDADLVTATSDAGGWFRADLLLGGLYDGWVIGPEQDGRALVCQPMRAMTAGGVYELRCDVAAARQQLQLQGAGAWQAHGPLRFQLFADERAPRSQPVALDSDGKALLPLLPRARHALAVYLADGGLLQWCDFSGGEQAVTLTLVPPVSVPVQALDENGAPVAGVAIRHRVAQVAMPGPFDVFGQPQRCQWRALGVTGADGKLTVQVPLEQDPFAEGARPYLVLCASKDGCADSHSGWMGGPFRDGLRLDDDARLGQVEFVMHGPDPAKGRLLAGPGQPLVGAKVRLTAISKVARNNGWSHLPRVFDVTTDAQGFYSVPQLPPDAYDFEVLVATPAPLREPLADKRLPVRPALAPLLPIQQGHAAALPVVDLQQTVEVGLRVLDGTKGPARGAFGAVFALGGQRTYIPGALPPTFAVDPAGRADLRLLPGRWLVCCLGKDGLGYCVVETDSSEPVTTIELLPFTTMHFRVVDGDGRPVAGAIAELVGRSQQGGGPPELDLLSRMRGSIDGYLLGLARSDGEGRLLVRVIASEDYAGAVRIAHAGSRSDEIPVEAGDQALEVVLR